MGFLSAVICTPIVILGVSMGFSFMLGFAMIGVSPTP